MFRWLSLTTALAVALMIGLATPASAQSEQGIITVPDSEAINVDIRVTDRNGNERSRFALNDEVRVVVHTEARNANRVYLNVVDIDADGRCRLIFPNAFSSHPLVPTGRYVLPDKSSYRFRVIPPEGTERVQAFASLEPFDLRELFNQPTSSQNPFPTLCTNPEQFADQVRASAQGLIAEREIATAWTSFQVGDAPRRSNQRPNAEFRASATSLAVGQTVRFDASSSFDPDGRITRFAWRFGDGTRSSGRVARHAFSSPGTYTVRLTVTDDSGATDTATRTVNVRGRANQAPIADFRVTPSDPETDETVRFTSRSHDPDGSIRAERWRFGDGARARGSTVFHRYARRGTFTVTLTVTDDDGATDSLSRRITVGSRTTSQAGIFVEPIGEQRLRVAVQGRSTWRSSHRYRLVLTADGAFTRVQRRSSGGASAQGIQPVPRDTQELELTGSVRDGRVAYLITIRGDTAKIKFDLRLDVDGDGRLDQNRGFVFLGSQQKHPPSNPFALSFRTGQLTPFVDVRVCLLLVDEPGFEFRICFRFRHL